MTKQYRIRTGQICDFEKHFFDKSFSVIYSGMVTKDIFVLSPVFEQVGGIELHACAVPVYFHKADNDPKKIILLDYEFSVLQVSPDDILIEYIKKI